MVQAPAPGVGAHKEAAVTAKLIVTITLRGETKRIAPFNLPLGESLAFRKATGGFSVESFWAGGTAIGRDSVKMLWWLARRADGEPQLTLEDAWGDFPDDLGPDDLTVDVDEPDQKATDPEV